MTTKAVRYTQPLLGAADPAGHLVAVPGASVQVLQNGVPCTVFGDNARTAMTNPVPTGVPQGTAGLDVEGTLAVYLAPGSGYSGIATVGNVSTTFLIPDISPDVTDVSQVSAPTYSTTAALNAVLAAAAASGSTVQVGDCTLDSLTADVTVPDGATLVCRGTLNFPAGFTGVGVLIDTQHGRGEHVIKVKKPVRWDTGADTTSVGVRLRNCTGCRVSVQTSVGFWTGLDLQGDGAPPAGNQDNTIVIGDIRNNKLNLTASTLNGGYSNNHEFSGGQLRHDGGFASYVGTREVYFPDSNGNTFIGVDLEANSVERTLDLGAPMNCFVGCRWESAAGAWLAAGATDTQFIGGYNLKEMPIHDSTGGRVLVIGEGVMSPGNNPTALGWSVGYRAGGAVPYVQFDPITGEYQFTSASDSFAGLHGSTMKTTGGIGVFGHAIPVQPAAPVTLADVIAIIRSYGFSA